MKKIYLQLVIIPLMHILVSAAESPQSNGLDEREQSTSVTKAKWRELLVDQIKDADSIIIEATPFRHGEWGEELGRIEGKEKIDEFIRIFGVSEEKSGGHCMCDGDALLVFKNGDAILAKVGYHHSLSMRWYDGEWKGDGKLSADAIDNLPIWFYENEYPNFYRYRFGDKGRQARFQADLARSKTFFTSLEWQYLSRDFGDNPPEWLSLGGSGDQRKLIAEKLLETTKNKSELAAKCFYALGTPFRFNETSNTGIWWDIVHAASMISDAEFKLALEQVHEDPWGALGAKEPFFRGGFFNRFDSDSKEYWLLKIADAVLSYGWDYDKDYILRKVASLSSDKSKDFLVQVAEGRIGREIDYREAHNYYGGIRSAAYLFLVLDHHYELENDIREFLTFSKARQDTLTLKAALALCGDLSFLSLDLYESEIDYIQEAFLLAVEKSQSIEKVGFLVQMIESEINEEDRYYVGPEIFGAFETAVGHRIRNDEEMRDDRWYPEVEHLHKAVNWWTENIGDLAKKWKR